MTLIDGPAHTSGIDLQAVTKTFGGDVHAVREVSLTIEPGEFMVLVGPSGCGKSTLLRMIAGLEGVTSGTISIAGRDVTHLQPRVRDIAMVFQNYALYPQMSVRQNLAFGLRMRKMPRSERDQRVDEVARALGLDELLERRPSQLSGGQRQRVAMGRAMVREPAAYLMDEPLSNLDAKLRVGMRSELGRLHERLRVTTVYVTHDQVEAMTLGQRVAVLRDGLLQQCDSPQVLFDNPRNLFVGAFIGSPSMNLVEAVVERGVARFAGVELPLPGRDGADGRVILGVRPDDLHVASDDEVPVLSARVEVVEELGAECLVVFALDAAPVAAEAVAAARDGDEEERLLIDDRRALWTARVPGRRDIAPGDTIGLTIDTRHVHVFDPRTGDAIGHVTAPV
jgi:multiple sugar transport system ATP-binding protein